MRNLLLSIGLIAVPVIAFGAVTTLLRPPTTHIEAQASLGDMSPFSKIVADVQTIAAKRNLIAAKTRISDFETAWDDAEKNLRPINSAVWGDIDTAADAALHALRANAPDAQSVEATLAALSSALSDPTKTAMARPEGTVKLIAGVPITDANGRPVPCETMLETFRSTFAKANLTDANKATVLSLQTKGTERCNADDDARADDFFAQGIALMSK